MAGLSTLDAFAPLTRAQAERIASLAADVGRMAADCAAVLFPLPLPTETRQHFEAETVAAIGELLDEFAYLKPADRVRFQEDALDALAARLVHRRVGAAA